MGVRERGVGEELTIQERVKEEMAAWDSMFRSAFKLPPYNPEIIHTRYGLDLYEEMMTDAQVRASINTKRYALLARPWQVFSASPDRGHPDSAAAAEARDFVEDALNGLKGPDGGRRDFRHTLFEMMSAFYRGFSVAEMIWRVDDEGRWRGKFRLAAIKFKNPKQIGFDVDEFLNVRSITSFTPEGGYISVPRTKCLLYVYNGRDELPYGDSDLRSVYKHWHAKSRIAEFWHLRLQRFGIPFAYVTTGVAPDSEDGQAIQQALKNFHLDATAVFPQHSKLDVLETTGGQRAFLGALEWHNQQIAIGILLQTLTSGEGIRSGSMALGRVHFDILLFALECMKYDVEAAVNSQIVRPLVDYNFGHGLYPVFSLGNINEKDVAQLAQAMDVLLSHKVVGPKEPVLREMFNLPPLADDGRQMGSGHSFVSGYGEQD